MSGRSDHSPEIRDPVFATFAYNLLESMLEQASNPATMGRQLVDQLRELTGARMVALVRAVPGSGDEQIYELAACEPERRSRAAGSGAALALAAAVAGFEEVVVWRTADDVPEAGRELAGEFSGAAIGVPLRVGRAEVGAVLIFGMPDEHSLDQVQWALDLLSRVSALVLRNANLFEEQEIAIADRTRELATSEERLAVTLHSIGDGVIAADVLGRVTFVNPMAGELTGWVQQDALGRSVAEVMNIVSEQTRHPAENPVMCVLREGQVVGLANHTVLISRDGSERPIADSAAPIRNSAGEVIGVVMVFRDQTKERRQARLFETRLGLIEYAARHSLDAFLSHTLDQVGELVGSPIGFYHFVAQDQRTVTLQQWSTRTRAEFCEAEGKGAHHNVDEAGVWAECVRERRAVIHNDYASLPHEKGLPDGHALIVRELVVPVIRAGRVVAVMGVGNKTTDYDDRDREVVSYLADVTWVIVEHKRAEEEARRLERQIERTQKEESLGRLAGGIAHDFNNMLNVILGHAEFALDQLGSTHPVMTNIEEIRKAAERSASLTRQLLAFARKEVIAPRVFDLNTSVEPMLNMLRRLIGEDMELAWAPGDDLWPVKLDPSQLDQILANLCVNARDASPEGGRIAIVASNLVADRSYCASRPGLEPGEFVLLAVSDEGVGMDQQTLDRAFDPYFTTREIGKGTGLGLATVQGIVKQNHGHIEVTSSAEEGTTFSIYLPRHTGSVGRHASAASSVPAPDGDETILLVEDEPAILEVARRMLASRGYTVLATQDPKEAIGIAEQHAGRFHLLLTDLLMPGMNGRALAERIAEDNPEVKILFMSGYTSDLLLRQGVADDEMYFVQKPFTTETLTEKVRRALDGEQA